MKLWNPVLNCGKKTQFWISLIDNFWIQKLNSICIAHLQLNSRTRISHRKKCSTLKSAILVCPSPKIKPRHPFNTSKIALFTSLLSPAVLGAHQNAAQKATEPAPNQFHRAQYIRPSKLKDRNRVWKKKFISKTNTVVPPLMCSITDYNTLVWWVASSFAVFGVGKFISYGQPVTN